MNNNIIAIRKKSWPYKYVTWDRITMAFKPNYHNIFYPIDENIDNCETILSQGPILRNSYLPGGGTYQSFGSSVKRYVLYHV